LEFFEISRVYKKNRTKNKEEDSLGGDNKDFLSSVLSDRV